jgi:hypothetical protein
MPGPGDCSRHRAGARKVDHANECDQEGKDEFPEGCIDAEGVNRAAIHREVGAAALKFFGAHLKNAATP